MTYRDRFEAVYDAYYPAIHQYAARRTDSPDDTADVISETFLTAWRRIGDVPEGERALLWLYGVARRVLANQKRGAARQAVLAERLRDELTVDRPGTPVDLEYVRTAFNDLSERDREVLASACWEELISEPVRQSRGMYGDRRPNPSAPGTQTAGDDAAPEKDGSADVVLESSWTDTKPSPPSTE